MADWKHLWWYHFSQEIQFNISFCFIIPLFIILFRVNYMIKINWFHILCCIKRKRNCESKQLPFYILIQNLRDSCVAVSLWGTQFLVSWYLLSPNTENVQEEKLCYALLIREGLISFFYSYYKTYSSIIIYLTVNIYPKCALNLVSD